jgi:hypothetical protein
VAATVVFNLGFNAGTGCTMKLYPFTNDAAAAIVDGGVSTSAAMTRGTSQTDSYSGSITGLSGLHRAILLNSGSVPVGFGVVLMTPTGTIWVRDSILDALGDIHWAQIEYMRGSGKDIHAFTFLHNDVKVAHGGVTSPTVKITKVSDGLDLIASTALTEIGSTGIYKLSPDPTGASRLTVGEIGLSVVTWVADGATWSFPDFIGRDV